MAKTSMIQREIKREKIIKKFSAKRTMLKEILTKHASSEKEREEAMKKLHQLPRNASPTRLRNRCKLTGRSHGYYRKFGLCRNKLREAMMRGDVPGLVKASW